MKKILNLTQHAATPEQVADGVIEPENKAAVQAALTFETLPTQAEVQERALDLSEIARDSGCEAAMVGGAPYLMEPLERCLKLVGVVALYAFSQRESSEQRQPDGSVRKVQTFRHAGWVQARQGREL